MFLCFLIFNFKISLFFLFFFVFNPWFFRVIGFVSDWDEVMRALYKNKSQFMFFLIYKDLPFVLLGYFLEG